VTSQLQRLVLDFRTGELVVRALYRRSLEGAANPGTKARRREVAELVRAGLADALAALEGDVGASLGGTSGFTQREDIMVANRKESAA
jgi:hypothetical protein